jgi:hypothetical protein
MNRMLNPAVKMLTNQGELEPCAIGIKSNGTETAYFSDFERQLASDIDFVNLIYENLISSKNIQDLVAIAVCFKCAFQDESGKPQNGIGVNIESQDGDAIAVFLPYVILPSGEYQFKELIGLE